MVSGSDSVTPNNLLVRTLYEASCRSRVEPMVTANQLFQLFSYYSYSVSGSNSATPNNTLVYTLIF